MQDHAFESIGEEREREAADAQSEHAGYHHHRGDDRVERDPFAFDDHFAPRTGATRKPARNDPRFLSASQALVSVAWEGQPVRQADAGASEHHNHGEAA